MFEFSVSNDMKKIMTMIDRRITACLLILIVMELKISVEQGRVVTTLSIIKR